MRNKSEKSASIMGASDKTRPAPSMSTRAKEAGKRGLEDITGLISTENKKKTPPLMAKTGEVHQSNGNLADEVSPSIGKPGEEEKVEDFQPVDTKTLNNHVALIMDKLNSIEGNTTTLNSKVSSLFSKMDDQSVRIKGVETSLADHAQQIGELKLKQSSILDEVNEKVGQQMSSFKESLRKDNELFRAELINASNRQVEQKVDQKVEQATSSIKEDFKQVTSSIKEDFMEEKGVSRFNNLIVMGLHEAQEGDSDRELIISLFKNRMGITGLRIDSVYRLGKPGGSGPRPVLVRFPWHSDRKKVWYAKSKLKSDESPKIWLQEDLPKPIKVAQRTLYQAFKKAKSMPDKFQSVQLKGTKLILDGKAYGQEDMKALPTALQPSSMATLHSDSVVVFFGRASPLSNHHIASFQLEGHRFNSMEQFLAWRRARLSGKKALINKALNSTNPVICKGILNELRDDNTDKWDKILDEVVSDGLSAKFEQNPELAQFLIDTHPKTLGEASLNKRWGIGLPLNSPDVFDTSKWSEGGNLLGKKLSQLRSVLTAIPV